MSDPGIDIALGDLAETRPEQVRMVATPLVSRTGAELRLWRIGAAALFGAPTLVVLQTEKGLVMPRECMTHRQVVADALAAHGARPAARPPRTLAGEWCCLSGPCLGTFWHWLTEALAHVAVLERHGYEGGYLLPGDAAFIHESLDLFGVAPDRRHTMDPDVTVVEALMVPDYVHGHTGYRRFPEILDWIREILLAHAPAHGPERLYVSRETYRPLVNEADLLPLLADYGFERVTMEGRPLRDQIGLVAHCRAMVAIHGAATAWSRLMPPGALVVELFSPLYINPGNTECHRLLRQRHHMVLPTTVGPLTVERHPGPDGRIPGYGEAPVTAPLNVVEQVLVSALGEPGA